MREQRKRRKERELDKEEEERAEDDLELLGDIFVDASPDEFIGRLTQVLRHVGDYCREGNSLRNFPRWQPAMLRSVRCEPALAADEAFHVEPKHLRKIMFREEE